MGSNTCNQMVPACFDLDEGFPKIANWYSSLPLPLCLLCMVIVSVGLSDCGKSRGLRGRRLALACIESYWSISAASSPSPVGAGRVSMCIALLPSELWKFTTILSLTTLNCGVWKPKERMKPYRIHKAKERSNHLLTAKR